MQGLIDGEASNRHPAECLQRACRKCRQVMVTAISHAGRGWQLWLHTGMEWDGLADAAGTANAVAARETRS